MSHISTITTALNYISLDCLRGLSVLIARDVSKKPCAIYGTAKNEGVAAHLHIQHKVTSSLMTANRLIHEVKCTKQTTPLFTVMNTCTIGSRGKQGFAIWA